MAAFDTTVKPVGMLVDRALSALRDGAVAQADVAKPGDGLAEKVNAFLREVFPSGVAAVTSLGHVEELAACELIVEKLQGPLAPMVAELGLTRQADRLAELVVEYRQVLSAPKAELTFAKVSEERARGQELLLETVALIIAHTRGGTPESKAARADLLAPILEQNEAVRRYLRARRRVEDVDPATGEVDPEAPPSGPSPEAASSPAPESAPEAASSPAPASAPPPASKASPPPASKASPPASVASPALLVMRPRRDQPAGVI